MSEILWENTAENKTNSNLYKFICFLEKKFTIKFLNYEDFYNWSINNNEIFWAEFVIYSKIIFEEPAKCVLKKSLKFNNNRWFYKAKLNFAKNLLDSNYNKKRSELEPNYIALIALDEQGNYKQHTLKELKSDVAKLSAYLRSIGIVSGDRVAGFVPNISEAVIAMLATTSIGAIWTACSPDFGEDGVLERFLQIDLKVLIVADGYYYKNKYFSCDDKNNNIINKLKEKNLQTVIYVTNHQNHQSHKNNRINNTELNLDCIYWSDILATSKAGGEPCYTSIDYNDPLYIVYSSGTTGKPKCIVHGVGGVLTEQFKEHLLHHDVSYKDKFFYFTSTSWMMWHWQICALGLGATVVIYDGAPNFPNAQSLLDIIDKYKITLFGASAKYYSSLEKSGLVPKETHDLSTLKTLFSTGSPLLEEQYDYIYDKVSSKVALCSISGGTDILGCFALGNPMVPIYKGELQSRSLGLSVKFYNDVGQEIIDQKGELVCTAPFPSMPLYFWNDPSGQLYDNAYFGKYENIWVHGDYGKLTSHHGIIIYGRSDAVLNPSGVRIGTAEIYAEVEKIPEVIESLAVGQAYNNDERIVLFVVLANKIKLDETLKSKIIWQIKTGASPRHVPAVVVQVPELPKTASGKLMELVVKNIISGREVKNKQVLANPHTLDYFLNLDELK